MEHVVRHVASRVGRLADVWVVGKCTPTQPTRERLDGVGYVRPPLTKATPTYAAAAARALGRLDPDIVQIENRPRLVARLRRRFPDRKLWLSLHSTTFVSPAAIAPRALAAALRQADRIIVNSSFLRAYLARRFPSVADRVYVNHLGVDVAQFASRWSPEGEALRARMLASLGYEGKRILLFVGRLIEKKGLHHLLDALPAIVERHPETVLLIVGSSSYGADSITPYVSRLHAQANEMPAHVRFVPFVPHDEVHRWYAMADVALVPSFEEEAFGLVNVEAMATGVPVVATRAGGMPELIVDGETGYLVSPDRIAEDIAEKVDALLANPETIRAMGEASVRRVHSRFTWEHTAQRLSQWYREDMKLRRKR